MKSKIQLSTLKNLIVNKLHSKGLPKEHSELIANHLIESEVHNHPSHGVARVPRYLQDIADEIIKPNVKTILKSTNGNCLSISGNWGPGIVSCYQAIEMGIPVCKEKGICAISLSECNDIGRLGGYLHSITSEGLIGIIFVNDGGANPSVAPYSVFTPFFSTNPIAAGFPTSSEPIIIDMATSQTAIGKIRECARNKTQVAPNLLVDTNGKDVSDPNLFFTEPKSVMIPPLGHPTMGHKGFALTMMVELLAGALTGAGVCDGNKNHRDQNGVFIILINPNSFARDNTFEHFTNQLLEGLKSTAPDGNIRIPGTNKTACREILEINSELLAELKK